MNHQIKSKSTEQPDDQLDFKGHGKIDIVKLEGGMAGMLAVLRPGWTWSGDEKPLVGSPDSCPVPHIGYCTAGELVVRMVASGEETRIRKGDFFNIPAGHDAYVPGDEACELVLFQIPEAAEQRSAA